MISNDIFHNNLIKIQFFKSYTFGNDDVRRKYDQELDSFIHRNRSKDQHFSHKSEYKLKNFVDNIFSILKKDDDTNVSLQKFIIFTLLLSSWPYRIYLEKRCYRGKFTFNKYIY